MNPLYLQTTRLMAQVAPLVFVDDMRIEVKVAVNFLVRGTVHPVNRASLASAARNQPLADVEPHTTQVRSSTGARGLVRPEGSLNRFDNSAVNGRFGAGYPAAAGQNRSLGRRKWPPHSGRSTWTAPGRMTGLWRLRGQAPAVGAAAHFYPTL